MDSFWQWFRVLVIGMMINWSIFHLTRSFIAVAWALKCLHLEYLARNSLAMHLEFLPVKTGLNQQMAKTSFCQQKCQPCEKPKVLKIWKSSFVEHIILCFDQTEMFDLYWYLWHQYTPIYVKKSGASPWSLDGRTEFDWGDGFRWVKATHHQIPISPWILPLYFGNIGKSENFGKYSEYFV